MDNNRAYELITHVFEDPDCGMEEMEKASVHENVYVMSYLKEVCIPKAEAEKNREDITRFQAMLSFFRALTLKKIMNLDKAWKVNSVATGYPYKFNDGVLILYTDENVEALKENLGKAYFSVEAEEMNNDQLRQEIGNLYRNGYKVVNFCDGVCKPFEVKVEDIMPLRDTYLKDSRINPDLQAAIISFFQEVRRGVTYEGFEEAIQTLEKNMMIEVCKATYFVPSQMVPTSNNKEEMEITHPLLKGEATVEGQKIEQVALPVFTDIYEMALVYGEEWDPMEVSYDDVVKICHNLNATGFVINFKGINLFINDNKIS